MLKIWRWSGVYGMFRWRIGLMITTLCLLLLGVILRLYQIQILSTRAFSKQEFDLIQLATEAQSREIILQSGRGKILDRNGQVIVGQDQWRLIVFPHTKKQISLRKAKLLQVSAILQFPYQQLLTTLQTIRHPIFLSYPDRRELILTNEQVAKLRSLDIPGILAVRADGRMVYQQIGQQLIGQVIRQPLILERLYKKQLDQGMYTKQSRVGISGIEASFEQALHGAKEKILHYYRTRRGEPLPGADVKIVEQKEPKSFSPKMIVTTLDKTIQQQVEHILAQHHVSEGAVVVQEIQQGDILAAASAPLGWKEKDGKNPWDHRAFMEATPGSVFKLLIAIAGLEEGLVNLHSPFHCRGIWEQFQLKDADQSKHGRETFAEAFAQSCNLYFGSLSKQLGKKRIEQYARQMGFQQQIIWSNKKRKQWPYEHRGLIFSSTVAPTDVGAVVQTGIGQRDVKITPIQAANLVTALFHQGKPFSPRLVKEIRSADGKVVERFPVQQLPTGKKLKDSTIQAVKQMMRQTVVQGTASSLKGKTTWQVAGKTGTAQTGLNKDRYHKWMVGFGPYEQPRYSVVVLLRAVKDPADPRAKQIFEEVMEVLANLEKKKSTEGSSLK